MKTTTLFATGAIFALAAASMPQNNAAATADTTCAPQSSITYTWSGTTGKGTATVTGSKPLCQPLYITTAVYSMDKTNNIWPQTLVSYAPITVKNPGTYQIGQTPACRQQVDIYASLKSQPIPPAKLVNGGAQYGEPDHIDNPVFWNNGGPWSLNTKACPTTPAPKPTETTPTTVTVTAAAPTITDVCDATKDTYTIHASKGTTYLVNGKTVKSGTYPRSGKVVTVTAQADNGYKLEGKTSWTLTFTDAACATPGTGSVKETPAEKSKAPAPTAVELPKTGMQLTALFGSLIAGATAYGVALIRNKR